MKRITPLLLIVLLLAAGCKTKKTATEAEGRRLHYQTLSADLQLTLSMDGKTRSLPAQLRIRKGEAIQLSLRDPFLGMELAKLGVSPSEVIFMDKWNKRYLQEQARDVQKVIPFAFAYTQLEELFTNTPTRRSKLACEYSDWGYTSDKQAFPMTIQWQWVLPEKTISLQAKFKKVEIDREFTLDWQAPSNYTRIPLSQLVPLIEKML